MRLTILLILTSVLVNAQMLVNPYQYQVASALQQINLVGRTDIKFYGDSYTAGLNASPQATERYSTQFATARLLTEGNSGLSGLGVWAAANSLQGASFTRSSTVVSLMAGFNDLRRNGPDSKTLKKIEACYKAFVLKCITQTTTPSGSASVTRSGTISGFPAISYGGTYTTASLPANAASSSSSGGIDSWTWTFTGTAFGVQFIGADGTTQSYGTAKIYIDGVLTESIPLNGWYDAVSDGVYDNVRGPVVATYHGLSNTSHTIKVESSGDGVIPLDFFAQLYTAQSDCASLLFAEVPYMDATGYAISPNLGSIATSVLASAVIKTVCDTYRGYGYAVAYVKTNPFTLGTDHIHPDNVGHDDLTQHWQDAILDVPPVIQQLRTNGTGDKIYMVYNYALSAVTPATTDFALSGSNSVSSVSVSGTTVTLSLASSYTTSSTITLSYTPGTNKIQSPSGIALALTSNSVANLVSGNTKSATFGASNQIAESSTNPSLISFSNGTTNQPFTIGMWLKYTGSGTYQRLLCVGKTNASSLLYELRLGSTSAGDDKLSAITYTDNSNYLGKRGTSALTTGTWVRVIVVFEPASGFTMYVNGTAYSTGNIIAGTFTAMPAMDATYILTLGGAGSGNLPATNSKIDEVIIVDKALSQEEITEDYGDGSSQNMANCSFTSNIKVYYKVENNLNDTKANYNMTSTVAPTYNTDVP